MYASSLAVCAQLTQPIAMWCIVHHLTDAAKLSRLMTQRIWQAFFAIKPCMHARKEQDSVRVKDSVNSSITEHRELAMLVLATHDQRFIALNLHLSACTPVAHAQKSISYSLCYPSHLYILPSHMCVQIHLCPVVQEDAEDASVFSVYLSIHVPSTHVPKRDNIGKNAAEELQPLSVVSTSQAVRWKVYKVSLHASLALSKFLAVQRQPLCRILTLLCSTHTGLCHLVVAILIVVVHRLNLPLNCLFIIE